MIAPESARRPLVLATISFTLSFAAWGLIGGLASIFAELYGLTASQTALLVAVPVLLGSLARLPMGMLTDRFGGRIMFTILLTLSAIAAWLVPLTTSYANLIGTAFFLGLAGSSFAIGVAFVSRWASSRRRARPLAVWSVSYKTCAMVFGGAPRNTTSSTTTGIEPSAKIATLRGSVPGMPGPKKTPMMAMSEMSQPVIRMM